jgi:hypothetical protein
MVLGLSTSRAACSWPEASGQPPATTRSPSPRPEQSAAGIYTLRTHFKRWCRSVRLPTREAAKVRSLLLLPTVTKYCLRGRQWVKCIAFAFVHVCARLSCAHSLYGHNQSHLLYRSKAVVLGCGCEMSGVVYDAMPSGSILLYHTNGTAARFGWFRAQSAYTKLLRANATDGSMKCRPRFLKNNLFRRLWGRDTYTRRHVFLLKPHCFHQRLYILRTHRGQHRLIGRDTA